MMIGKNLLCLNEATMCKVVEEWLQRKVTQEGLHVGSVHLEDGTGDFVVELLSREVEP